MTRLADLPAHVRERARAELAKQRAPRPPAMPGAPWARDAERFGAVIVGDPPIARRLDDELELVLLFAPRTKKGHTTLGIKQSAGYTRFKNAVVKHLASLTTQLGLPLPERRYNCAAVFYVDNDAADTVGLMQGLADALENAGVLTNDRQIATWDGTRQELARLNPRVELTLTPIAP